MLSAPVSYGLNEAYLAGEGCGVGVRSRQREVSRKAPTQGVHVGGDEADEQAEATLGDRARREDDRQRDQHNLARALKDLEPEVSRLVARGELLDVHGQLALEKALLLLNTFELFELKCLEQLDLLVLLERERVNRLLAQLAWVGVGIAVGVGLRVGGVGGRVSIGFLSSLPSLSTSSDSSWKRFMRHSAWRERKRMREYSTGTPNG